MGILFTKVRGNILTTLMGNVLTEGMGKVLDIYIVLSDQVKRLDWKTRNAEFCDKIPEAVVLEILKKLETLLSFGR